MRPTNGDGRDGTPAARRTADHGEAVAPDTSTTRLDALIHRWPRVRFITLLELARADGFSSIEVESALGELEARGLVHVAFLPVLGATSRTLFVERVAA